MDTEQELAELRARVAHLEALVERAISAEAPTRVVPETDEARLEGFSRRRMLRNGLGLSAAAVAGVGMLDAMGSSAAAVDGDAVTIAATKSPTTAASAPTRILNPSSSVHSPVLFQVDNTTDDTLPLPTNMSAAIVATFAGHDASPTNQSAVLGLSQYGTGVDGRSEGAIGVSGKSYFGTGVSGSSTLGTGIEGGSTSGPGVLAYSGSGPGIKASSDSGYGVHGIASGDDAAVFGDAANGFGVIGNGDVGVGASGNSTGLLAQAPVVGVDSTSTTGFAVKATTTSGTGLYAIATSGIAVDGQSAQSDGVKGTSGLGAGVHGLSTSGAGVDAQSDTGVGGRFAGGRAAIHLDPRPSAGHPTSGRHLRGDLIVDAHGRLWLCTKAGTPGTWRKVAFV